MVGKKVHNMKICLRPAVVIPVLKIRKTNYNSEGFIRVVFQSPSGKIQGDPQTMKFKDSFVIRSTKGLDNMLKFVDYKSENNSDNYEKMDYYIE